jgi:hypothetical protein
MSAPTILRHDTTAGLEYALTPDAAVILMADGSARILDMGDRLYALPAVGALMLRETLAHGSAAAVQRVTAEYAVTKTQAEADLQAFLATLETRGVICRPASNPPAESVGAWPWRALAGLFHLATLPMRAALLLTAARMCLKTLGWRRTVALWRWLFPVRPVPRVAPPAEKLARAIDDAVQGAAAWNPLGVACKERALSCWALARNVGLPTALVIGVELFPFSGHCWCEAGSWILSDHADNCAPYLPVLRYQ